MLSDPKKALYKLVFIMTYCVSSSPVLLKSENFQTKKVQTLILYKSRVATVAEASCLVVMLQISGKLSRNYLL